MREDFYRAFEDRFRGSRREIASRLESYLPFIAPLKKAYPKGKVLDIGCGRGEWLELMESQGFETEGFDLDDGMLAVCRQLGLKVTQGDGLAYLKSLETRTLTLLSAFHVVEHLPFQRVQELIQEAHRVLQPGGLLILETPNPENILVSTHSFYMDPTHRTPIPSDYLGFLAEYSGFHRHKVLRLQEPQKLREKAAPSLWDVLSGASPDYAVIAQKESRVRLLASFDAAFESDRGLELHTLSSRYDQRLENGARRMSEIETALIAKLDHIHQRLNEQVARLNQAEQRADQANAHLEQILRSKSWSLTRPLRWTAFQIKLLREHGLMGRMRAVLKKLIRFALRRLHQRPKIRLRVIGLFKSNPRPESHPLSGTAIEERPSGQSHGRPPHREDP